MALIKCPECGGKVSDKADACIHCGYPLRQKKKQNINEENILTKLKRERYEREERMSGKNKDLDSIFNITLPLGWYF